MIKIKRYANHTKYDFVTIGARTNTFVRAHQVGELETGPNGPVIAINEQD
jgi:hypothetical protein